MNPSPKIETAAFKSLGLNALLDILRDDGKISILDLGQACGANVDFWSQFQCRLYIEDFYRSFQARLAGDPEADKSSIMADLVSFAAGTSFDLILAWDLFNYFDLEELEVFIRRLSLQCRRGTLVFAMISSLPQIPLEPMVFKIIDRERMIYESPTQEVRPCPRHQPRDIARLMARFDVSSSFFLRHGVQEYIFAFRG